MTKDEIAARLSAEMQMLLKIDAVDPHRPFLELGADSIVLNEAVQKIENSFGVTINVSQFFEAQSTIDTLAAYIFEHAAQMPSDEVKASQKSVVVHPAAPAQIDAAPLVGLFQKQLDLLSETIEQQNTALMDQMRKGRGDT